MATLSVTIHPDPALIRTQAFPDTGVGRFNVLYLGASDAEVCIFIDDRSLIDALQAALAEIQATLVRVTLEAVAS